MKKQKTEIGSWIVGHTFMLIATIFFFCIGHIGCAGGPVQVDQGSQEVIASITSRRIGNELAKSYPAVADEILILSKEIMAEEMPDIIRIAIDRTAIIFSGLVGDPMLAADVNDILELIKIETDLGITIEQMQIVRAVAKGLTSGIEINRAINKD